MKNLRNYLFILIMLSVASAVSSVSHAAKIQAVTSAAGIKAWLVDEPSIPMISMKVAWTGGARLDPDGKEGLANLVAATIDEGSKDMDSKAYQAKLSDLAIKLGFDASKDSFTGALTSLSENKDVAFQLFGQALSAPRFDAEPVERIRTQILSSINRRLSDPGSMAGRAWFSLAFSGHPYEKPSDGTLKSVKNIEINDLRRYLADYIARDNMVISVVGDIRASELASLLDRTFASLPLRAKAFAVAEKSPADHGTIKVIDHDIPQSVIRFGGAGVKRSDPDFYAAYILNYVVGGGGFESRLTTELREKRGLVYSIYSYLAPYDHSGLHMGGFGTANATVAQAIDLTKAQFERVRKHGLTDAEIEAAKTYINGSFPLQLSSNANIAGIMVAMQRYRLPITYLEDRANLINAVTSDDIRRVALRLLDPDKMIVVVVGKPENLTSVGVSSENQ